MRPGFLIRDEVGGIKKDSGSIGGDWGEIWPKLACLSEGLLVL